MRLGLTFLCQVRKVRAPEDSVMGNAHPLGTKYPKRISLAS